MYRPTPLTEPGVFAELEGGGRDEMLEVQEYQTGTTTPAGLVAGVAEEAIHTSGQH